MVDAGTFGLTQMDYGSGTDISSLGFDGSGIRYNTEVGDDGRDFIWHSPWQTNYVSIRSATTGYASSLVQAKLVGADALTNTGSSYAGTDALTRYTSSTCMLAAFPAELRAAIGAKSLAYSDGLYSNGDSSYDATSDSTTADKLWLMSLSEAGGTSVYPRQTCRPALTGSSQTAQQRGNGSWLRSPYTNGSSYAWGVYYFGYRYASYVYSAYAVAPGFSLAVM